MQQSLRWLVAVAVGIGIGASGIWLVGKRADDGNAPLPAGPEPGSQYRTDDDLRATAHSLREGGAILYFRHAQRQKWDSVIAFDVWEMATSADSRDESFRDAVCLTPQGIEEAKMIGRILELAKVPVGNVVSSPSCRAMQTAELAFGRIDRVSHGLAHTPVTNTGNRGAFTAEVRRTLTSLDIPAGSNAVVSAHGNTLENMATDVFASGSELVGKGLLLETGFYVIRRDANGDLHVVERYQSLGSFAAAAIDLDPKRSDSPRFTVPAG